MQVVVASVVVTLALAPPDSRPFASRACSLLSEPVPWMLSSSRSVFRDHPQDCPECGGAPTLAQGQCNTCGAMLVAEDPKPGEFLTTTLIPIDPATQRPVPRRQRRSIRIQDGYKRQSDGGLATVFRVIDKANGRYRETVKRDGVMVREVDEPLREHRGRGSARHLAHVDRGLGPPRSREVGDDDTR